MTHAEPVWPAVIKHQGDDELLYLADSEDWQQTAETLLFGADNDVLIDSQGRVYSCLVDTAAPVLQVTDRDILLADFSQILKQHMVALNQCCVSKLHIDSIAQGLQMVKDTLEDRG
jgi:hypothetical protein